MHTYIASVYTWDPELSKQGETIGDSCMANDWEFMDMLCKCFVYINYFVFINSTTNFICATPGTSFA